MWTPRRKRCRWRVGTAYRTPAWTLGIETLEFQTSFVTNDVAANEVNGLTMSRRAECDERRIQMVDGHERLVRRIQRHLQAGVESEGSTSVSTRGASELAARVRRLHALGEAFAHVVVSEDLLVERAVFAHARTGELGVTTDV